MIQKFSYAVNCPDGKVSSTINEKCQALKAYSSFLLDAWAIWRSDEKRLDLTVRVSGTDRWKCARYARQTAKLLLGRHGLLGKGEPPIPVSVETEQNLRGLTLEQGRTVRDYPDRATRRDRRRLREPIPPGTTPGVRP